MNRGEQRRQTAVSPHFPGAEDLDGKGGWQCCKEGVERNTGGGHRRDGKKQVGGQLLSLKLHHRGSSL